MTKSDKKAMLFSSFDLPESLQNALDRLSLTVPTPIQQKAIPLALAGKDILGSARTGTGKTAAFVIPLLVKMMSSPQSGALILAPTRELAVQVSKVVTDLSPRKNAIGLALLIGGDSIDKQFRQLRTHPRIIVGTPGRIIDHLNRRSLQLKTTDFLVLDETDRMLDMGFGEQIEEIVKFLPKTRQTLMFSATLPANITRLSQRYLKNPERIAIKETQKTLSDIQEEVIHIKKGAAKYNVLVKELEKRQGSIIVFVKTKRGAEELASQLSAHNHSAEAMHGDLRQHKRNRVLQAFRNKRHRIMVATDVAARGLDIPHIEHVINYDLPHRSEDYVHRIGRTARAGAKGFALNLVSPKDAKAWKDIHRFMQTHQNGADEKRQPAR
jgi:ATP-dependent RNA helicase DeaD